MLIESLPYQCATSLRVSAIDRIVPAPGKGGITSYVNLGYMNGTLMPLCRPFLLLLFYQLPRRALHPQLRVPSVRELEVPRQRLRALALRCGVYED
jgi:hypothetical protein